MSSYTYNCVGVAVTSTYTIFTCGRLKLINLAVLLAYEWCITFGDEVNLFWRNKMSLATCLFVLNRYVPLMDQVMAWVNLVILSEEVRTLSAFVQG